MNIVLSEPVSGKAYSKKTEESVFLGKIIGDVVELSEIGLKGFKGKISGGSDKNGFPMRKNVEGTNRKKIFMGDAGSLALGGIIAVFSIAIRKELLIPVLCGIFLIENMSVIMQVGWFKITKKRFGVGRRIFKMAPLHHHYQKLGVHEAKIVGRFWIIGVILAVITIVTLKLR